MKLKSIIAFALIASAAVVYAQTVPPATVPSAPVVAVTAAPVATYPGRFQLIQVGNTNYPEVWMIDTQTGDTWRRQTSGGAWTYAGNPTVNPGTRSPQPVSRGRAAPASLPAEAPITTRPAPRPPGMP